MSGSLPIATFLAPDVPAPQGGGAWTVPVPRRRGPWVVRWLARGVAALRAAWRRQRSRARIAALTPHLLKDIGVSHAEAEHEANKPFWQA